jgi:hypothetical protein
MNGQQLRARRIVKVGLVFNGHAVHHKARLVEERVCRCGGERDVAIRGRATRVFGAGDITRRHRLWCLFPDSEEVIALQTRTRERGLKITHKECRKPPPAASSRQRSSLQLGPGRRHSLSSQNIVLRSDRNQKTEPRMRCPPCAQSRRERSGVGPPRLVTTVEFLRLLQRLETPLRDSVLGE